MKKLLFLLASFSILSISAAVASTENLTVSNLTGEAQIIRGSQSLPAQVGTSLQTGDILNTSPDGTLDLALNDVAGARVLPSSEFSIESGSSANMKLKIKEGNAILNLKKLPEGSTFQVETPTAVAAVRGTQFWGRVVAQDPANPVTTFAVREGMVEIVEKSTGKVFNLEKGQALDIPTDTSILPSIRPALEEELRAMEQASQIKTSA